VLFVQASIKALEQNLAVIEQAAKIFPLLSSGISMGLAGPHKSPAMQPLNFCVLACEPLFLMTARRC
jgi:hypothetical protein